MLTPQRTRQEAEHKAQNVSRLIKSPDFLIGLSLFLAGLYAYTATLAPTVLEGDAALYQYTPYVLGVTYPTGYPFYILLGKLWVTLFPFGEIAWRMNLFSALCSAAALPLIYGTARRLLTLPFPPPLHTLPPRFAALVTVLTFATLPTFWRWSTEAKIYSLNILLFSGVLYTLALAWEKDQEPKQSLDSVTQPEVPLFYASRLSLPAFLLGLQIAVHSTTVLLIPGLLLLTWFHCRSYLRHKKFLISYFLFLTLPGLLYLYIPLRAEGLIAGLGREEAIRHGLLADFYHSGLAGWIRYFSAADFTGGVVTNWGLVPQQFISTYLPILSDELTLLGIGLGVAGGLALAVTRPRLFWPLFLLYAAPIPFVLAYGQGEQSAFLLPSLLIFSLFTGNSLMLVELARQRLSARLAGAKHKPQPGKISFSIYLSVFILLFALIFLPQINYNVNWLKAKWDRSNYNYWADVLAHPLKKNATLLAQWADLTSFWYMQYAENRRADLRGLYPPTAERVTNYLDSGGDLYIAGPGPKDWVAAIENRYQLLPWGRLVRIAPQIIEPQTLLPSLPQPSAAIFDNKLRLLGADFAPQAVDGQPYGITLTWQTLADLPAETTLSLRLSQAEVIAAQLDDPLLSGWFPRNTLPPGQYGLSYMPLPIPVGTLPGLYRLQLVVYINDKQPWSVGDGATLLDLGQVALTLPPANSQPDPIALNPSRGYDFNGEITLADYDYTVTRVGQGKGFGVKLLWQAQTQPADNYTLLAELVDGGGKVLRSVQHQPVGGRAPTASWQPGQYVRDQVDLVLPASAPVGPEALQVRLSWQRPNGSRLPVRRWLLPVGQSLSLNWINVTEKEGRVFTAPEVQYPVGANFANKARLIGYNSALFSKSGLQWSREQCVTNAEACLVHFDLYWQALSEMDQLYFVFLHWVDAQGKIVAQQDKSPGLRGKEPTTSWLPNEVILDPIDLTLPADLPPGQYTLRVGMYLPPLGPRLIPAGPTGQDFVEIGTIEVIP